MVRNSTKTSTAQASSINDATHSAQSRILEHRQKTVRTTATRVPRHHETRNTDKSNLNSGTNDMRLPNAFNKIALFNQKVKAKSFRQALEDADEPLEHERAYFTTYQQPLQGPALSLPTLVSTSSSRKVARVLGKEAVNVGQVTAPLLSSHDDCLPDSPTSPSSFYYADFEEDERPHFVRANESFYDEEVYNFPERDAQPSERSDSPSLPALPDFDAEQSWFAYSMATPAPSTTTTPATSPSPPHSHVFFPIDACAEIAVTGEEEQEYYLQTAQPLSANDESDDYITESDDELDVDTYSHYDIDQVRDDDEDAWSDVSGDATESSRASTPVQNSSSGCDLQVQEQIKKEANFEHEVDEVDEIESLDVQSVQPRTSPTFKSRVLAAIDTHAAQLSSGKYSQPAISTMETRATDLSENVEYARKGNGSPASTHSTSSSLTQKAVTNVAPTSPSPKDPVLDFSIIWERFRKESDANEHLPLERPVFEKASGSSSSISSTISSSQSSTMLFTEPPSPAASSASSLTSLGRDEEHKAAKETLISQQAALDAQYKLAAARDALKRVRHNVITPTQVETLALRNESRNLAHMRSSSYQELPSTKRNPAYRNNTDGHLSTSRSSRSLNDAETYERRSPPPSRSSRSSRYSGRDDLPILPSRSDLKIGMSAPKNLAMLARGITSAPIPQPRIKNKGKTVVYRPQTHITSINEVLT